MRAHNPALGECLQEGSDEAVSKGSALAAVRVGHRGASHVMGGQAGIQPRLEGWQQKGSSASCAFPAPARG
eukprot:15447246-Alexandrium_andersonii.AAC.1